MSSGSNITSLIDAGDNIESGSSVTDKVPIIVPISDSSPISVFEMLKSIGW